MPLQTPWSDINEFINDRFTWADLTKTETGIENIPTPDEALNIKWLADTLAELEADLGAFNLISAFRSQSVQAAVKGEASTPGKKSFHEAGMAADLYPTTQSIEDFYGKILAGPWKDRLGEIALKPTQNAIHISLPTEKYRGVAMVMDSAGNYIKQTAEEVAEWASPYLEYAAEFFTDTDESGSRTVKTGVWVSLGAMALGLLWLVAKPKRS